jgi:hypothetical protein
LIYIFTDFMSTAGAAFAYGVAETVFAAIFLSLKRTYVVEPAHAG